MIPSELLSPIIILCTVRLIFGTPSTHLSPEMSAALHLLRPEAKVSFAGACLGEYRCSEAEVASYAWQSSHADTAVRKRFWHTYDCTWNEDPSQCPVDGGWSSWSEWGDCDTTCGDGTKLRYRACDWPQPKNGGNECHGQNSSVTSCRVKMACPPPDNDSTVTKGSPGESVQHKALLAMEPFNKGNAELQSACMDGRCSYQQVTEMVTPRNLADVYWTNLICYKHFEGCPVDGGWSEWSMWSSCSSRCGTGKAYRSRRCASPQPRHGGRYCDGTEYEEGMCFDDSCVEAVGVLLTPWSMWSACSTTCNDGVKTSTRRCHGSDVCDVGKGQVAALLTREIPCSGGLCPEVGGWSEWSAWTVCSAICSKGRRVKERACNKPRPQGEGNDCEGESFTEEECSQHAPYCEGIPEDVTMYEEWSHWSECSAPCDSGMTIRHRTCLEQGHPCRGELYDLQLCNDDLPCKADGDWTPWTEWSVCTVTCGEGDTERYRQCSNPRPEFGGLSCEGDADEKKKCLLSECPADTPTWESWGEWSQCTVTCAGGTSTRTRGCLVSYGNGQEPRQVPFSRCAGEYQQINVCNYLPCPVDGNWASWGDWASCSRSCGDGVVKRDRTCTDPAPAGEGEVCGGYGTEIVPCYQQPCPVPDEILRTFDGSAFMMYHRAAAPSKLLLFYMRFMPSNPSSLLALRHDDVVHSEQMVTVGVANGHVRVYAKLGQAESVVVSSNGIHLNKWNRVEVTISGGHTSVRLNDGAPVFSNFTLPLPAHLDWDQSMYIGGALPYLFPGPAREYVGFVGAISALRVNYKEYTLHDIRPEWTGVGLPFVSFDVGTRLADINAQVTVFTGREYTFLPCPNTTDEQFSLKLTLRPDGPDGIVSYVMGLVPGSFVALTMMDSRVALFVSFGDSIATAKSVDIALSKWAIVELTLRGREAEMRVNGGPAIQLAVEGTDFAPAPRVHIGGVPGPDRTVARMTTGWDRGLVGAVYEVTVNRYQYLLTETALNMEDMYLDSASTTISAHYREVRRPLHSSVALHCNYANIRKEKPMVTWLYGDKILEESTHVSIFKPSVFSPHKSILNLHILQSDNEGPYACMVWYRGKAVITHAFGVSIYEPKEFEFHLESNVELMVIGNVALIVGFIIGIIALSCFRVCRRRFFFLDMMHQSTVFYFGLDEWAWLRDPDVPDRATMLQVNATFDKDFSAREEKIKFDQALKKKKTLEQLKTKAKEVKGKMKRKKTKKNKGDVESGLDSRENAENATEKPGKSPEKLKKIKRKETKNNDDEESTLDSKKVENATEKPENAAQHKTGKTPEKVTLLEQLKTKAKEAKGKMKWKKKTKTKGNVEVDLDSRENADNATNKKQEKGTTVITVTPNEALEMTAESSTKHSERSEEGPEVSLKSSQIHNNVNQSAGTYGSLLQRKPSESLSDREINLRRLSHEIVEPRPVNGDSVSSLVIPEDKRQVDLIELDDQERRGDWEKEEPLYVNIDTIRDRRRQSKSSLGSLRLSQRGSSSTSNDSEPPPAPPRLLPSEETVEVDMDAVRENWRQSISREILSDYGASKSSATEVLSTQDRRRQSMAQAGHDAGRLFNHRGSIGGAVTKLSEAVAEDAIAGFGEMNDEGSEEDEMQDEDNARRQLSLVLEEEDGEDQPLLDQASSASASDEDEDESPDDNEKNFLIAERDSSE
ncbi:uncharacterized protein LOC119734796 isoform X2 [Patiria miniata]|uniref:Hemicentin-1 n=1 Tax=Patiria miniata TaxID=46514 RepID=A0A914ALH6_PATMI|nr:uncharacterized protein LOC119734796 isoform X2 [Patiria miniata]